MKQSRTISALRKLGFRLLVGAALLSSPLLIARFAEAQSLQIVNMAIPAQSFQMVIYPIAQQKGYMKEEGLDQRVIFVAPTTSIQAMLGGDVQFTGAGSSALVSIARGNTPLKVVVATNDRVLQWLVTRPEITSPKDLKGKRIATTGVAAIATFMVKQVLTKHGLDGNKDVNYLDVGQGNQLAALLGGGFDAAVLSVEQRYVALDKGMREMFFMGNEVKNSWGTLATTDKLIKENPKMVGGLRARDDQSVALHSPGQRRNDGGDAKIFRRVSPAGHRVSTMI